MLGSTHIAIGTSFGVLVTTTTGEPLTPLEWTSLLVGSLAPDLDQGNALISRPGSLLFRFLPKGPRNSYSTFRNGPSKLLFALFGHRNFIHWPLCMAYHRLWNPLQIRPADLVRLGLPAPRLRRRVHEGRRPTAGSFPPKAVLSVAASDRFLAGVRLSPRALGLHREGGLILFRRSPGSGWRYASLVTR